MAKDKDARARRRKERLKRDRLKAETFRRDRHNGLKQVLDPSARGLAELLSLSVPTGDPLVLSNWGHRLPLPDYYADFDRVLDEPLVARGSLRRMYSAMLALTECDGENCFAMIVPTYGLPSFESLPQNLLASPNAIDWLRWTMKNAGAECRGFWAMRYRSPDYPDGTTMVIGLDTDGRLAFWVTDGQYPWGGGAPHWYPCANIDLIADSFRRDYEPGQRQGDVHWRELAGVDLSHEGPMTPQDPVWAGALRRMQNVARTFLFDVAEGSNYLASVDQLEVQIDQAGERLLSEMLRIEKLEAELASCRLALERATAKNSAAKSSDAANVPRPIQSIADRLELYFCE